MVISSTFLISTCACNIQWWVKIGEKKSEHCPGDPGPETFPLLPCRSCPPGGRGDGKSRRGDHMCALLGPSLGNRGIGGHILYTSLTANVFRCPYILSLPVIFMSIYKPFLKLQCVSKYYAHFVISNLHFKLKIYNLTTL